MQIPLAPLSVALLLAISATGARAESKAAVPAATSARAAAPIGLSLPSAATPASAPGMPATATPSPRSAAPVALPSASFHPALPDVAALAASPLESASDEVKRVARWVADSRDNAGLPYLLIDKANAQVYVFDRSGRVRGTAPVLLGMAKGDRMLAPNEATMAEMPPQVRITPAGRFVSRLARDSKGKELLVMDYAASLSLHPVVKGTPKERRAERMKSPTSGDNRVSFGCINVPVPFYSTIVSPAFRGTKGIVYVLPETSAASAYFGFPADGVAVASVQQGAPAPGAPTAAQPVPAAVAK